MIWDFKRAARLDDCTSFVSSVANAADCVEDVPKANMSVRFLSFIVALESKLSRTPELNTLFGSGEGIGVIFVCVGVELFSRLVLHLPSLFTRLRSRFFTSLVTRFRFSTVLLGGTFGSEVNHGLKVGSYWLCRFSPCALIGRLFDWQRVLSRCPGSRWSLVGGSW